MDRIPPGSTLIRDTLNARLNTLGSPANQSILAVNSSEFDDVRLAIQTKSAEDLETLIISLAGAAASLPEGAKEVAAGAYSGYAVVLPTPSTGYHISLEVSLRAIPSDLASRAAVVEHLSCLRCIVFGTPLRNYFAALAGGPCAESPLVRVNHR